jgi:hypothetical protein
MMGLVKQTLRTENPTVDPLTLNQTIWSIGRSSCL